MEHLPDEENGLIVNTQSANIPVIKDYRACKALDSYDEILKDEPMTYHWSDLNVFVGPNRRALSRGQEEKATSKKLPILGHNVSKKVLHNVTGIARPNELVAIMGVSGAGKTTLLNALTFREPRNMRVVGDRCVNGEPLTREILKAISCYVTQDEMYIPTLTVREHLVFNAKLRMHKLISHKDRIRRVEEVLDELGLRNCANTRIGEPGKEKCISGGEARRLSFATEILTDPAILFCDEPTSGLDSYMAQNVIQVLKTMADKGKTIICTVHQPSSHVYAMFDRIILMAEGQIAYAGPRNLILSYFQQFGKTCPQDYNPADFFVELTSINPAREDLDRTKIKHLCAKFEQSEPARTIWRDIVASMKTNSAIHSKKDDLIQRATYKASWMSQFSAILHRSTLATMKNPFLIRARLFTMVLVALLYGVVYFGQRHDQEGIMNITGVLFLMLVSNTFQSAMNVILTFCSEIHLFRKEHAAGYYRADTYFLGKTIAELPIFLIQPIVSTAIIYWMVGLRPEWSKFFIAVLIVTLVLNTSVSFGYMISCLTSNISVALALGPALLVPLMLFGGFFINTRSTPEYLSWIRYISWFYYGHEALMVNEWHSVTYIACNRTGLLESTCLTNGTMVLESLGFNEGNISTDMIGLTILFISFRLIAFILLVVKSYFY